jgi:hypothetical protein
MNIKAYTISTNVLELGDSFVVATVELIKDNTLRLWFNKEPSGVTTLNRYSLDGAAPVVAQLAVGFTPALAVDLYFNSLSIGQHTLTISSLISVLGVSPAINLPATQIVFDIAADIPQVNLDNTDNSIRSFLPRDFKNKASWDSITDAIQYGDTLIQEQAREAYEQMSIATATGSSLTTKATDQGVSRPSKMGLSDNDFRKFAIAINNEKLTSQSILNVLEVLYGDGSTHAYLETLNPEPYQVFDKADLELRVDGKIDSLIILNVYDFQNPLRVTAQELCSTLNQQFAKLQSNAEAQIYLTNQGNKVRVYSKTRGAGSFIQCLGGTLQPFLVFNNLISDSMSYTYQAPSSWEVTTPVPGTTRFEENPLLPTNTEITNLRVGDYVVITGGGFNSSLWGTHQVTKVDFRVTAGTPHKYFEIEA